MGTWPSGSTWRAEGLEVRESGAECARVRQGQGIDGLASRRLPGAGEQDGDGNVPPDSCTPFLNRSPRRPKVLILGEIQSGHPLHRGTEQKTSWDSPSMASRTIAPTGFVPAGSGSGCPHPESGRGSPGYPSPGREPSGVRSNRSFEVNSPG